MPPTSRKPSRPKSRAPLTVYGSVVQYACDRLPDAVTSNEFRQVCGRNAGTVLTMAVIRGNLDHIGPSLYRYNPEGRHGGDARVLAIEPTATSESDLAARARVGLARVRRALVAAGIDRFSR